MPSSVHENDAFIIFLFFLVLASFTAYYANTKGRSPFIWFALAILIGVLAPLILLFLPSMKNVESDGPAMTVSNPDPSLENQIPPPITLEEVKRKEEEDKLWYYLDKRHKQVGPVSIVALREEWNTAKLDLTSYVWSEGMEQWAKIESLPDLKDALNKR